MEKKSSVSYLAMQGLTHKLYAALAKSLTFLDSVSVQLLSHVWLFATPWTAARQASLSITNSWKLRKLMSIESVMPSNYLILCCPLLLLPSIFPSIRVVSNESVLRIRWPEYWRFGFSISPSNEHPGLISFRISLLPKGLSRVFSNITVQKHQFFGTQPSLQPNSHIQTWLHWLYEPLSAKWCLCFLVWCLGLS